MKTWKRRLAAAMAAVMLVSLLPVTALAEETETLPEESPASSELGETPVNSEPEETPVNSAPEETPPTNELEEPGLDIQELGVTVGGQYVAAVPVDELPPEELTPQEEELLAGIPAYRTSKLHAGSPELLARSIESSDAQRDHRQSNRQQHYHRS